MSKSYVILGGGGVFGQQTAKYLLEHADLKRVICVGRNQPKSEPFTLNIGKGDPRYAYQQIHVTYEQDRLFEMFDEERPEIIISYAAQGEGAASWKDSWRFFETNSMAMVRMAETLAQRTYLERFIQIGTSELYGSVTEPSREDAPIRPTSPYAASKAAFDLYLMAVSTQKKFPMNILRPSNAYAPGQQLHRVIPRAVLCGLTGQRLPLHGGGQSRKCYIHASDLARAIHLVAGHPEVVGRVYNVGPARPTAIVELVQEIAKALDMPFTQLCETVPGRFGDDSQYWLDSDAIRRDLGWRPAISLQDGLREMVEWGRAYLPQIQDLPTGYTLRA